MDDMQRAKRAAADYHILLNSRPAAVRFILSEHSDQDSLVQAFARIIVETRADEAAKCEAEIASLREELRKADEPYWYYPAGDGESPSDCLYELIDYIDYAAGEYVLEVDTARPSRKIWCSVRVTEDADADERFTFTEHDSEEAARAALSEQQP